MLEDDETEMKLLLKYKNLREFFFAEQSDKDKVSPFFYLLNHENKNFQVGMSCVDMSTVQ